MAHLTNFSFEFFYEIFTEDASLLFLYHGAKKSKMTKNSNQGGPALKMPCATDLKLSNNLNDNIQRTVLCFSQLKVSRQARSSGK